MKFPEKFLLKLPEGTMARVEAVSPNRSEWIRDVLLGALDAWEGVDGGGETKSELVRPGEAVRIPRGLNSANLRPDALALLEALRKKPMTPRDAEKAMGWLGLRYANAEKALIAEGLVVLQDGVLVAEGAG
jgi:hypothetical protein